MWTTHLCTISYVANHVHKSTENSRSPNLCWNSQSDSITRILIRRYCSKLIQVPIYNCISLGTFQQLLPNQQLDRSMLILENYNNSPVSIIGKFKAFIQWKGKVFHQVFHVTNANFSPNLLSRDVSFRMEVLQTCFAVTGKELPQLPQRNKVNIPLIQV